MLRRLRLLAHICLAAVFDLGEHGSLEASRFCAPRSAWLALLSALALAAQAAGGGGACLPPAHFEHGGFRGPQIGDPAVPDAASASAS